MKISITEVSARLASDSERLCRHLLPAGRRHGQEWLCGGTNGHTGDSLKVNLGGEHVGKWRDWADTEHGDLLDLWACVKCVPLTEALKQAKDWLGIRPPAMPEKSYNLPADDKPPLSADGRAMHWLVTERKLTPAIVNRYKVQGDAIRKAVVFPSYSPSGRLINRSYRALELNAKGKKETWQDTGAAPSLWGWQAIGTESFEKREILICEGQIDAMTWAQWGVPALSIPNGSGQTWLDYEWQNLEVFKTIFLSFDTDGKSDKNLADTLARLGKHRCRIVTLPAKDANDALRAGHTDAARWLSEAHYVDVPSIACADKYTEAVAERFFPTRADSEGFTIPITTHRNPRKSFRFRAGELTIWTGTSGHGKSTVLNFAVLLLAVKANRPSFIVSMETAPPEIIYRQMKATGARVTNNADVHLMMDGIKRHLLFYDRIGHIAKPELFEVMQYAYARYGIANLVIDSLMRIDGMEENYPAQTALFGELATFARETGCHVHIVAHPRKSVGDDSPRGQDVSGSGNLRNNCDNLLSLWRNTKKERDREDGENVENQVDATLSVEKDRMEGEFRRFALRYAPEHYRYDAWAGEIDAEKPQSKKPYRNYHQ